MDKDLYKLLGVKRKATLEEIKKAHRELAKKHHPDQGGDEEKFKEIQEAYRILSNPERRERYDTTGRTDDPVSKEEINEFIREIMTNVVNARRIDGSTDDPEWEDIRAKILNSMRSTRQDIVMVQHELKRKLKRVNQLLRRFKAMQKEDPVGDFLRTSAKDLSDEILQKERLIERSREGEKVFLGYQYEVGPDPEGQDGPDPTLRLTSGGVLHVRAR